MVWTFCSDNDTFCSLYLFIVALWGESDDSNSEIEAALRPQPYNTNTDDIDDFYDWNHFCRDIFFLNALNYISAKFQADWLVAVHPLTIILVACIVNHMHTVS